MKKILLCNPEVSQAFSHSRKGMYPPLGLLSLATRLDLDYPEMLEIRVIDGDTDRIETDCFKDADLVCFHVNSFNYENVLRFSITAKSNGTIILYGGPHATVLWKNIMTNRPEVDYIITEEGEIPLSMLVGRMFFGKAIDLSNIPNLVYRKSGSKDFERSCTSYENTSKDMITPLRKYIDVEKYIRNAWEIYKNTNYGICRPFSIYSGKGCSWRERSGGCVFCARLDKNVKYRDICQIWSEVRYLKEQCGADHIWDISDDNLNSKVWFKEFVNAKPDDLSDLSFLVYSRVNGINDETIEYLKKLNVFEVYLGFESGDPEMLKKAHKGSSVKVSLNSATKLAKNGIKYFPSFVIGLPGESRNSLENTFQFLKRLRDIGGFYRSAATILMPIPGSRVFEMLLKDETAGKVLNGADSLDIKQLERLWIDKFTDVEYEVLEEYQSKMNALNNIKTFGAALDKE